MDGLRVAAVLSAHAGLQARAGGTALLDTDPDQPPHTLTVERLERRGGEHALVEVGGEERGFHVVAGEAPGGLGEIVGAEGEELRLLGDRARRERGPGQLDHRADGAVDGDAGLLGHLGQHPGHVLAGEPEFLGGADERHHDLRPRGSAGAGALDDRLGDRPHLHGHQPRYHQCEPYAAQAEHRVLLVHAVHGVEQLHVVRVRLPAGGLGGGDAHGEVGAVGQEFVQGWIQEPDGDRQTVHRFQDGREVPLLEREKSRQGPVALGVRAGQDHLFDQLAPLAEEHVLGTAQSDALRAEPPGTRRVLGGVGVGPHLQPPHRVGVVQSTCDGGDRAVRVLAALQVAHRRGVDERCGARVDVTRGSVHRDDGALRDDGAAAGDEASALGADGDVLRAAHADLAHPAGDHRRMAGLAAPAGQHRLRGDHAGQVVRGGLLPHQHHLLAGCGPAYGLRGVEDGRADRGAR